MLEKVCFCEQRAEVEEGTNDMTMKQAVFKEWDNFVSMNTVPCNLEADLVFVPMVLEDHYFCVCVNFIAETAEVLDNTVYDNWDETGVFKAARLVVCDIDNSKIINNHFKYLCVYVYEIICNCFVYYCRFVT